LFILIAFLAPLIAPYDPLEWDQEKSFAPPSWVVRSATGKSGSTEHLLGTDYFGRDMLSRLIYGARSSMLVALLAAAIMAAVGISVGLVSGYAGGRVETLLMRITDVMYAFPAILFYITFVVITRQTEFGKVLNGIVMVLSALVLIGWVGVARLVHGATLSIKQELYIEAAQSVGVPTWRILLRHILPNLLSVVLVWFTFAIPRLILVEATLGYLGIGVSPVPDQDAFFVSSWGGILNESRLALHAQPGMMISVLFCLILVGVTFSSLGDRLRDALDPRNQ
jgi:oligopeptide transport system permease protein